MSDAVTDRRADEDGYVVREYGAGDREQFLSLYASVWGRPKGEEWFDWRFADNPYGGAVRMVVAERDGEMVGAEPALPFRVRANGVERLAYQPVDWIVHPDHRRRGLFTRMTERLLDVLSGERTFLFNFPTDALLPGLDTFDWHVVGTLPNYYRVQRPSPLLEAAANAGDVSPHVATAARPIDPILSRFRAINDRLTSPPSDVAVERHATVPASTLVEIHRSRPIDRLHVARDEAFYRWRFSNPHWETTTYLARTDGEAVSSLVAATETVDGVRRTSVLDVQPMRAGESEADAFDALLGAVVSDHRESDVLRAAGAGLAPTTLRRWGFRCGDTFPLSRLSVPARLVVRPLPGAEATAGTIEGTELADPDDWLLTLADQDVG